jgi:hypothetical protein
MIAPIGCTKSAAIEASQISLFTSLHVAIQHVELNFGNAGKPRQREYVRINTKARWAWLIGFLKDIEPGQFFKKDIVKVSSDHLLIAMGEKSSRVGNSQ